jgi:hypothetical protein
MWWCLHSDIGRSLMPRRCDAIDRWQIATEAATSSNGRGAFALWMYIIH